MKCFTKPYQGFQHTTRRVITFTEKVCYVFSVSMKDVFNPKRGSIEVCKARNLLYYYYHVKGGYSQLATAKKLLKDNHTSTSYAIKSFKNDYDTNPEFKRKCNLLGIEL